ncbi:hypothetical protein [uncultured Campylobacter sp.]|uniref:hypothetical protein n=1 Tax=uncultured Campylobacter sp. TaxID=218934 RepID=UPI002630ED2F|nr:hypothetical protein [uncultured Campylobacter sp.]
MIAAKISRLKIYPQILKTQPRRLKFDRSPALNLAAHLKFNRALILNFIARRRTLPAKQTRRKTCMQSKLRREAKCAVNFIVSQRSKFYTAKQEPTRRWIKFTPQSKFHAAAWFTEILRAKLALQNLAPQEL